MLPRDIIAMVNQINVVCTYTGCRWQGLVAGAPGTGAKISLQPEKDLQEIMVEQVFPCSPWDLISGQGKSLRKKELQRRTVMD